MEEPAPPGFTPHADRARGPVAARRGPFLRGAHTLGRALTKTTTTTAAGSAEALRRPTTSRRCPASAGPADPAVGAVPGAGRGAVHRPADRRHGDRAARRRRPRLRVRQLARRRHARARRPSRTSCSCSRPTSRSISRSAGPRARTSGSSVSADRRGRRLGGARLHRLLVHHGDPRRDLRHAG